MATRRKGGLELDSTVETLKTIPLDARQLVRTKEELLDPDSFTYGYKGMIVACRDEEKLYMLIDNANPTVEASWKEIGGSTAGYDDTEVRALIAALQSGKANVADLSVVATSGNYNDLVDRPVLPAPYDDSALSGRVSALENAGFLTEHQDISGKANVADLSAVATSGSYNDLSDQPTIPEAYDDTGLRNRVTALENKTETQADWNESDSASAAYIANKPTIPPAVTVDAAMSDTSENPVQNKIVLAAIGDAIDVVETAIADRYTKAETDAKIAEAMIDVDNEHFHPVTALPDPAAAKENHEYVLITYAQDGTTIESETHYLFYDGVFHEKQTQVSLDGYATETYVDTATGALDTRVTAVETSVAGKAEIHGVGNSDAGTVTISDGNDTTLALSRSAEGDGYLTLSMSYFSDEDDDVVRQSVTFDFPNLREEFDLFKRQMNLQVEQLSESTGALDTRVTAIETALDLTALTDQEIAALVPA